MLRWRHVGGHADARSHPPAAANEYAGKRAARVGPVGDARSLTACPLSGLDLKPHYTYNHVLRIVARELETLFRCPSSDPDRTPTSTHSRTGTHPHCRTIQTAPAAVCALRSMPESPTESVRASPQATTINISLVLARAPAAHNIFSQRFQSSTNKSHTQ